MEEHPYAIKITAPLPAAAKKALNAEKLKKRQSFRNERPARNGSSQSRNKR